MRSRLAVTSFILGLIPLVIPLAMFLLAYINVHSLTVLSLVLFPFVPFAMLGGVIGFIMGVVSIFVIKKNNLEGMKYAIMGIIFSIVVVGFGLLIFIGIAQSMGSFWS